MIFVVLLLMGGSVGCIFFFFKQKTAYEMRISDWSSDVCSSDLPHAEPFALPCAQGRVGVGLAFHANPERSKAPSRPPLQTGEGTERALRHRTLAHRRDRKSTRLNSSH